ncbi:MAG: hypothetical protein PF569_02495 [Candidatus Woesearchaeota archaeon]|nr:hypothetical protein [Candidatus Woesearchaeota archaeon]
MYELKVCDLELAKLLKEVDFNWDSKYYFNQNDNIESFQYFHYDRNYDNFEGWPEDVKYFAPTLELVKQWFREIHNIHIIPTINVYNETSDYGYKIYLDSIDELRCVSGDMTLSCTYNQALTEALKEAAKLIKNNINE